MSTKSDNFKRIAENRTNKILDLISLLGNLSNKAFYEYSEDQIMKIFATIEEELNKQKSKFIETSEAKPNRFKL